MAEFSIDFICETKHGELTMMTCPRPHYRVQFAQWFSFYHVPNGLVTLTESTSSAVQLSTESLMPISGTIEGKGSAQIITDQCF